MKISVIIITVLVSVKSFAVGTYYYFDPSVTAVKTVYNAKGEIIGHQEYKVYRKETNSAYGINTVLKPGKENESVECFYQTEDNKLMISMGKNVNGKNMFLDYARDMNHRGIKISSVHFETTNSIAGSNIRVLCTITNRKVIYTPETITSAGGKWECIKSEYDMELKGKICGIGIPVKVHIIEWFAPGTGIVRTDVFRKGKLYETRLLTAFNKSKSDGQK